MDSLGEQLPLDFHQDELRLQRIGARLLLERLLAEVRNDWNGQGVKLWAEQQPEMSDE